jgi:hypothetical protein
MDEKALGRFMAKVNQDGPIAREGFSPCWDWTATRGRGYGMFHVGSRSDNTRKMIRATHASYEHFVGPVGDKCVLHYCDRPCCVNPDHLRLGTQAENVADMIRKGRAASSEKRSAAMLMRVCRGDAHPRRRRPELVIRGEAHSRAKLTEAAVREIRAAIVTGETCRSIASRYGIDSSTVVNIANRKSWKHVA